MTVDRTAAPAGAAARGPGAAARGPGAAPAARRLDPAGRAELGERARERVPLASQADLPEPAGGRDPVGILAAQAATRVPELVPIRHGRMLSSPFAFLRGAAAVMAADLAPAPTSGLVTQICGDAHLSNFGVFGSPERRLLFDVNDFDETYPGPWEWDVKRLAASLVVAARENGCERKVRRKIVLTAVGRYRQAMTGFARMRELAVWYSRADLDEVGPELRAQLGKARHRRLGQARAKARTHDSVQATKKLTVLDGGQRRIVADPPLVMPVGLLLPQLEREALEAQLRTILAGYRRSLQSDRRRLLEGFEFVDLARKVVGVGSVGLRCWIVLLRGRDDDDPLLLQVKEAQRSVLADAVRGVVNRPRYGGNEGRRVVAGQRLMQAASDIFLGWQSVAGVDGERRDFYVRQLRDWKASVTVEGMEPAALRAYGGLCAWTLARAHARSGDRIAIASYLGEDATFDHAVTEFAERYADRTEGDLAALSAAVRAGRVAAETGV